MFSLNMRRLLSITLLTLIILPFQNCGFKSAQQHNSDVIDVVQQSTEDTDPVEIKYAETSYEPVLVDRYYMKKLFTDIFGPSTGVVDSARNFNNALDQGSPCSIYEAYNVYDPVRKAMVQYDPMQECSNSSPEHLVAPVNPKASVTRQALLTRMCSDLTTNETTLKYAMGRISTDVVPTASEANLHALFRLFYRAQPEPHQGLLEALMLMFPTSGVTRNHWRSAIFTVCISSYWQVL